MLTIIDDSKVTDHHAILVTATGIKHDWKTLSESERNIMTLVAYQMLIATYSLININQLKSLSV